LKGWGSPHPKTFPIACGTVAPSAATTNSRKRKGPDEPSAGTSQDRQRRRLSSGGRTSPESSAKPICCNRPVVTMIIHWANNNHQVRALLDTGCSVPLISRELAGRLQLSLLRHEKAFAIENYTSEAVEGVGQFYTRPMLLQHRKHFSKETFEVSPMEPKVDLFLPFW
jgi:hypothetical protein